MEGMNAPEEGSKHLNVKGVLKRDRLFFICPVGLCIASTKA